MSSDDICVFDCVVPQQCVELHVNCDVATEHLCHPMTSVCLTVLCLSNV